MVMPSPPVEVATHATLAARDVTMNQQQRYATSAVSDTGKNIYMDCDEDVLRQPVNFNAVSSKM